MFHLQMRDGSDVVRAFNLDEETVREGFIAPLRGDKLFPYADKEWDPRRVRLTIVEGRRLHNSDLMLGRGWQTAEKVGTDVTERFTGPETPAATTPSDTAAAGAPSTASTPSTAPAPAATSGPAPDDAAARLSDRIIGRLAAGPVPLGDVVVLAGDLVPDGAPVSAAVALAEQTAARMLDAGTVSLSGSPDALTRTDAWFGAEPATLTRPA